MSCTVCGSQASCNCNSGLSCGSVCTYCQSSSCNGGCCRTVGNSCVVPATPQPYYACASSCQESNTQKVVINQFAVALKVANSWNIPACGLSASLTIPGLVSITIGSYLWNEAFGYFEVTAFDPGQQEVTVINHCNEGNAVAGTNVPSCTEFLNAAPPPLEADTSTPCLEIDFTAPAVSDCIDITLNNTNGVTSGDTVQIGSGFYRVSELKPNNIITICNDGDGIAPGTSVIAKDASGNFNYCLQIISTSPCEREEEFMGDLVICNGDGLTTVLKGSGSGMIPVLTDTNTVEYRNILPEQTCTRLIAPLNIVNGTGTYTLAVDNSGGFAVSSQGHIGTYSGTYTVTGTPDATHMTVTIAPTPSSTFTFPTGTVVCSLGCCELLQQDVDDLMGLVCQPAVYFVKINPQIFDVTVDIMDQATLYFEHVVSANLASINLSGAACPANSHLVKAHLSIATIADFTFDDPVTNNNSYIYHELEAQWSVGPFPATRQAGRMVWADTAENGRTVGEPFPSAPFATFGLLPPQVGRPITYHQGDIQTLSIMTPPLGTTVLGLSYRALIGTRIFNVTTFNSIKILVSGWVEVIGATIQP